jgi:hypothetical protein
MKKLLLISLLLLSVISFSKDVEYNLILNFDSGANALLQIEDIGAKSYITLISDDVSKMQVLRWEQKDKMIIYYIKGVTIYLNSENKRFTISIGKDNYNGNWKVYQ